MEGRGRKEGVDVCSIDQSPQQEVESPGLRSFIRLKGMLWACLTRENGHGVDWGSTRSEGAPFEKGA